MSDSSTSEDDDEEEDAPVPQPAAKRGRGRGRGRRGEEVLLVSGLFVFVVYWQQSDVGRMCTERIVFFDELGVFLCVA